MINIGIVDDHAIVRAGLRDYFSLEPDFRVVGEARDGSEAVDLVKKTEMDVLLMDLLMPRRSGLESLPMIRAEAPRVRVLIYTCCAEGPYAAKLVRQGASGFVSKEGDPQEVVQAIRAVVRGRRHISPATAEQCAGQMAHRLDPEGDGAAHGLLSEREFQVFLRLARGERMVDIASGLQLSIKTVSTYRTRILEKMHLASNADLTYYAVKVHLIE